MIDLFIQYVKINKCNTVNVFEQIFFACFYEFCIFKGVHYVHYADQYM